jgi:RND family efflux transporter MFP subunit
MKKIFLILVMLVSLVEAKEIYATFNVVAQHDAQLTFIAGGIVNDVRVDVGSRVHKGDILATLDNTDIKAMLQSAKITYKFAKRSFERQKKIQKLIDEAKFDKVTSAYEKAKNSVDYEQALYEKTFLKAPFDGVIYEKNIEVGDGVSGMMLTTVFKIQSQHHRKLIISFDQKYYKLVHKGEIFRYSLDGDPRLYKGVITKVYPHANATNRKLEAEVLVDDVLVGLFGDGYIIIANE